LGKIKQNMIKEKLTSLREKIDNIDQKIIKLFEERMAIVSEVKKLKEKKGEKLFIKPEREFDMIAKLADISAKNISSDFIFDIWRKIITYANCLEQDLKVDLFNPQDVSCYKYILRDFYSKSFPIRNIKNNFSDSLQKLNIDKTHIIIANLFEKKSDNSCWWVDLFLHKQQDVRIFTAINNKIIEDNIQLFSIGKIPALPSKKDKTIFVIKNNEKISYSKSLGISLLNCATIEKDRFYLFEIEGFYNNCQDLSDKINNKAELKILGQYPIL
jgi:chorismate mutase